MKKILSLLACVITLNIFCLGQKPADVEKINIRQAKINKQNAVSNFELQIKNISNATVRNYVRCKIAVWLWQSGKDETGQAEDIAVKAFEEIQERKNEIPNLYFSSLQTEILTLLESKSPLTADKLVKKYGISDEENLALADSQLNSGSGEKLAAEKIKSMLSNRGELSPGLMHLIEQLSSRKSPELATVLSIIVEQELTGRTDYHADTLFLLTDTFRNSILPNALKGRFYNVVIEKTRRSINSNGENLEEFHDLLYAVLPDILKNAPDLSSDAAALLSNVSGRINNLAKERNAVYEKIENSDDKLEATIAAAETAENESIKKSLYNDASRLALKKKKFRLAIKLLEKSQAGENLDDVKNKFALGWHDQFLGEVSEKSLKADDFESSLDASGKIINKLNRAEAFRKAVNYLFEKQNISSAADLLEKTLSLVDSVPDDSQKIKMFLRLIPECQKVDRIQTGYLIEKTAKSINSIPPLNVDDKPGTEGFDKYTSSTMVIGINLLTVSNLLMKENKTEALQLAERIDRREIKIIAELAVLTNSLK